MSALAALAGTRATGAVYTVAMAEGALTTSPSTGTRTRIRTTQEEEARASRAPYADFRGRRCW